MKNNNQQLQQIFNKNELANADELAAALKISELADRATAYSAFRDYQELKSAATLNAHRLDLAKFAEFINTIYSRSAVADEVDTVSWRLNSDQLYNTPESWAVVSHGLIKLFKKEMADQGYALTSINRALSTIRKYASLAMDAGVIDPIALAQIKNVTGYRHSEAKNVDEKRSKTRIGRKKEEAVPIPLHVVSELKSSETYPNTAAGRRDRLTLCLFLDHGLRASEVAGLKIENVDLETQTLTVYRKKTNTTDLIYMTEDTWDAITLYFENDALPHPADPLLLVSNKSGRLSPKPLTRITASRLMNRYGKFMAEKHGLPHLSKLSAHDGRHQWATDALEAGTPLNDLQQAGGWKSPAMPLRYANKSKIANKGVKLNR